MMHKFGLKLWSTNTDHYFEEAQRLYAAGVCSYVEIYVIPNTLETLDKWKTLGVPINLHCPHFLHGFNLAKRKKEEFNRAIYDQVKRFADELNSEYIVFHGGIGGNIGETARQLKAFREPRALIENKPHKPRPEINGIQCRGSTVEEIKYILAEVGCGFCLDIGHAICSANSQKLDRWKYLEEFNKLTPKVYHLTDNFDDQESDQHLHIGEGNFDMKRILSFIKRDSRITVETKKNSECNLSDFEEDVDFLVNESRTYEIKKNEHGFYEVTPSPSIKELLDFYEKQYYQVEVPGGTYAHNYSAQELVYKTNAAKVAEFVWNKLRGTSGSLFDIGCGEGFISNFFLSKGWDVLACDFSSFGVEKHNPSVLRNFIQGDISEILDGLVGKKYFDLIILSNVIEHVVDPVLYLNKIRNLMHGNSLLMLSAPNDFSDYQMMLNEKNLTNSHWLAPPEHVNYFSLDSLSNITRLVGLKTEEFHGDFPIEIFLSNTNSNYVLDESKGKYAHNSRLVVGNFIIDQGIEKYINYMKSGLVAGLSRSIIMYLSKK
jgi:sugar phosphate isomerase/epimerase/SAM-dependent methyltransferase